MASNPHDRLFKRAFTQPSHAQDALRAILPPALLARLDLSRLSVRPGSFVDEKLAELMSDILYSVPLGDDPALVWVLLEHQSSEDELMALRLLRYMVRAWEALVAEEPSARRLPVIVPVVMIIDRCDTCHLEGTEVPPSTAACTSCHDGAPARAHAELETTSTGVEACAVCHGADRSLAADLVHGP